MVVIVPNYLSESHDINDYIYKIIIFFITIQKTYKKLFTNRMQKFCNR